MKRCKHNSGWFAIQAFRLYVSPDGDRVALTDRNKVLMKCNIVDCHAMRDAYFGVDGRFVKFGRIVRG